MKSPSNRAIKIRTRLFSKKKRLSQHAARVRKGVACAGLRVTHARPYIFPRTLIARPPRCGPTCGARDTTAAEGISRGLSRIRANGIDLPIYRRSLSGCIRGNTLIDFKIVSECFRVYTVLTKVLENSRKVMYNVPVLLRD